MDLDNVPVSGVEYVLQGVTNSPSTHETCLQCDKIQTDGYSHKNGKPYETGLWISRENTTLSGGSTPPGLAHSEPDKEEHTDANNNGDRPQYQQTISGDI